MLVLNKIWKKKKKDPPFLDLVIIDLPNKT